MSFQDFINAPIINGYRGLHTTIILEDGTRVRCKIRTSEMQEYARKGITIRAFSGKPLGVLDILPWTQRIAPLSTYTADRSKEFWESLQSDILGESIVVHALDNRTMQLPKGSTALDGAFFLFQEDALKITTIKLNGREVPFSTPVQHAASFDVSLSDSPTVQLSWLGWVHTGYATAKIRAALATGSSQEEKLIIGRDILQSVMLRQRKGFIEEFDEQNLRQELKKVGYDSLAEAYIAIADGRIEPDELYDALFETNSETDRVRTMRVTYKTEMTNTELMDRLGLIHRKYRHGMHEIRYRRFFPTAITHVRLTVSLTPQQQRELGTELARAGAMDVQISPLRSGIRHSVGMVMLIALWGLDPVIAHQLLNKTLSVPNLLFIRFITFFIASFLTYTAQTYFSPQRFKPLSPFEPPLFASGAALFATALLSYTSLRIVPASQYILFVIGGLFFVHSLQSILQRKLTTPVLSSLGIVIAILIVLFSLQGWSILGLLSGAGSGLGFALYSLLSKRYQDTVGKIRERYPAYLFWVSAVCLCLSLLIWPYTSLYLLRWNTLLLSIGFSVLFAVAPYVLYFEFMRRIDNQYLDSSLPLVCISTAVGEAVIAGSLLPLIIILLSIPFVLQMVKASRQKFFSEEKNGQR